MENDNLTLPYLEEYNSFVKNYKSREVSGEEVGEVIVRMATYFSEYNMKLVETERNLYLIARDIEGRVDENSGKTITSAKAQSIINATGEHHIKEQVKAHVQNIEQFINALKALQRGVLSEYAMSSL